MEHSMETVKFDPITGRDRLRLELYLHDPLSPIKIAAAQWDRTLYKSLHEFCALHKFPFYGEPRNNAERLQIKKWIFQTEFPEDICRATKLFLATDLLLVMQDMRDPPCCDASGHWYYKTEINLPCVRKNFGKLWHYLDELKTQNLNKVEFPTHTELCADEILAKLRTGQTPAELRGAYWAKALNSEVDNESASHWKVLNDFAIKSKHILDALVCKDVAESARNSNQFFIFVDLIYHIMLCFSRDTEIAPQLKFEKYPVKGKPYQPPPAGVVPITGTCLYAAPFCYMFKKAMPFYFTFRAFYIRFCQRWATLNTDREGVLGLCLLVERLLQQLEPELWNHLCKIQLEPIRIVFKWIVHGFSGRLQPEQLLILWDLVIGYNCSEIISLMAFGILCSYKPQLLMATGQNDVTKVLRDFSDVNTLAILKLILCKDLKKQEN